MTLLSEDGKGKILVVHPPEYGHWRKAMMEDLGILTGGRVIARDLGGRLENVMLDDLGQCEQVKTSGSETIITRGAGDGGCDRGQACAGHAHVSRGSRPISSRTSCRSASPSSPAARR